MKLSSFILMITILNVGATVYSQTTKLNAQMTDVTVKEVFKKIEDQSQFRFFYSDDLNYINKKVNINATHKTVEKILDEVLKDSDLTYKILENNLIIIVPVEMMQGLKITGTVTDANGDPLPGVNIVIKGTSVGVVTNANGKFDISAPSENSILVFTFIGFDPQEIAVGNRQLIDVVMQEASMELGEIVVTATGNKSARAVPYAITMIGGNEIANTNTVNTVNALQGKVAGVQINMGNSGPQSAQRIIIRGNTSLGNSQIGGSNNQPIFVIDGVIIDNSTTGPDKWGAGLDFGNDIKNLNSDDFESLSVLKGAAATALYGSRAGNGVILITTKKGRKGEGIGVTVSHSQQWDKAYDTPNFQNKYGDGYWAPGATWPWSNGSESRNVEYAGLNFGPAFDGKPYTIDGYDEIYQAVPNNLLDAYQTAHQMNTNVAVHGGSETNTFRLSYSNLQSTGLLVNNEYTRNSFSANVSQRISKFLDAEASFSYVRSVSTNPQAQGGGGNPIYDYIGLPRSYDTKYWMSHYKNSTGSGRNTDDYTGYNGQFYQWYENRNSRTEDTYRGYLNLNGKITDWLSVRIKGDFYKWYANRENKVLGNGDEGYAGSSYGTYANDKDQYKLTGMLTVFKNLNDFNINATAAVEQWDTREGYSNVYTDGGLKIPGQFLISNSVNPSKSDAKRIDARKRINSIYAFATIDWKNQLYLDLTGRNDWSSSLVYPDGSGNDSYFYPSVSVSWVFTDTFKDKLPGWVDFGKFRASYAIVGNDTRHYLTNEGYYAYEGYYKNVYDQKTYPVYGFDSNSLRNLNLKPEKKHAVEFGLEARFLNSRAGFDITYYKENTKNQILSLSQPSESGVDSKWINAGNIQNQGIELIINGSPIRTKDFDWNISWNYTLNRNKIIDLYPGIEKYEIEAGNLDTYSYATVGEEYGAIYTPYAYVKFKSNTNPNHPNNGKNVLGNNSGQIYKRSGTMEKVGNTQPKFLTGMTNEFRYKGFTFNVLLDARFGGDIVSGVYNYGSAYGSLGNTMQFRDKENGGLERTLSDGSGRVINDGAIRDAVYDNNTTIGGVDVSGMTMQEVYEKGLIKPIPVAQYYYYWYSWGNGIREEAVHKCSWISLREISLWYKVPEKWSRKFLVQRMEIGLICRNVAYLYNSLPQKVHPEGLYSNRTSAFVEVGGQPYSRAYSFKVNLSF